jgi:hypothetical protein
VVISRSDDAARLAESKTMDYSFINTDDYPPTWPTA